MFFFKYYLADNLAYFPHTVIEDVLFIIKHADSKINGAGNDLIHTFEKVKSNYHFES